MSNDETQAIHELAEKIDDMDDRISSRLDSIDKRLQKAEKVTSPVREVASSFSDKVIMVLGWAVLLAIIYAGYLIFVRLPKIIKLLT
jgi:hypothetical protein